MLNHHTSHITHEDNHHGMDDVNIHQVHSRHNIFDFLKRFMVCSIMTIPVLVLSEMIQDWLGFSLTFDDDKYFLAFLATVIFLYGGYPFLKGFFDEMTSRSMGMMTLIGVAITVAWIYSVAVTFGLQGMDFYWEMATLIDIMLIGHYFEMKSLMGASHSLDLLVKMMPSMAHHVIDGQVHDMPVVNVKVGDTLMVKPGESIPADGIVTEGESYVDVSMLTGESQPIKKQKDSETIGGSINKNGSLLIKVTRTGRESYLNKVVKLVDDAQKMKSVTQGFADKAAKVLTIVALGGGLLTLFVWIFLGFSFAFALERMVTVMVISCPHALGLAIPLVISISTTISAKKGLLIRNRTAFENTRLISTVIFDKTGTLTKGSHELIDIKVLKENISKHELLRLASGIEQFSEHHIAIGLMQKVKELNIEIPGADHFNYMPGQGVEGNVEGKDIKVVGQNYFSGKNVHPPDVTDEFIGTIIYVIIDSDISGYFRFSDQIRETAPKAIHLIKEMGIKTFLLTGDNDKIAKSVCDDLKMDGFLANVLPHQKFEKVKSLQDKGEFIAMAGDGVNDAPALAKADVGIAVGTGTDLAAETADIILVNSDPKDIATLISFGKATYKKMMQNLGWAVGYNVIAIPLAAGVLYQMDILLSPALGALMMSSSTIVVSINAQSLRKKLI